MNRPNRILSSVMATGILGITGHSVLAQTTVFSDTFSNGSTTQQTAATPTANSTTYQWFQSGSAPNTPVLAAGDMTLANKAGTSSLAEIEALFTSAPVSLQTVGDSLNLTIVFKDTLNMVNGGVNASLNIGLYNSGGVAPNVGAQLNGTTYTGGGGSQNWNGYVGRMIGSGNSSIFTRGPQTLNGTSSQNQDVLFNNASGSSAYNSPTGTTVATSGGTLTAGLTQGNTYTLSYTITLTGANTVTINNNLYNGGAVDSNNLLMSQTGSTSSSPVTTYDAFGFGWRYSSNTSAASTADVNSITVSDNIAAIPEPSAFALAGLGLAGLAMFRRSRV